MLRLAVTTIDSISRAVRQSKILSGSSRTGRKMPNTPGSPNAGELFAGRPIGIRRQRKVQKQTRVTKPVAQTVLRTVTATLV